MNSAPHNIKGRCRCGQVEFEVGAKPMITMACHCTGCQQMTSSAFGLSSLFSSAAFSITTGVPVIGGLHGNTCHFFCGHCMSWLFTRPECGSAHINRLQRRNLRCTSITHEPEHKRLVTTYSILRSVGVPVGKKDYMLHLMPKVKQSAI